MGVFSLCVFCGSRSGDDPAYQLAAQQVGQWLGENGFRLVYGGGRDGLMGTVASATLAAGGQVLGVIPRALVEREHANTECTELLVVETMHERKVLLAEHAHAILTLPGGLGTLDELLELWTLSALGYHHKPQGLLNTNGYYDGLLGFLQHTQHTGFVDAAHFAQIRVQAQPQPLLDYLRLASMATASSATT